MDSLIEKASLFIINTLYHQTIFCLILFIFIFGLAYLLKEKSPRWQLGLWFLILIRLLLPTDLDFSLSARNLMGNIPLIDRVNGPIERVSDKQGVNQQPHLNPILSISRSVEDQDNHIPLASQVPDKDRNIFISWPLILSIAWLLGCLISLILFLNKIRSIDRVLDHSSLVQKKGITSLVDYWRQSFKIRRPVTVFSSDEYLSPFTIKHSFQFHRITLFHNGL